MWYRFYKITSWVVTLSLGVFGLLLASTAADFGGGFKAFTVLSGSMEPSIKTGSMVFIRRAQEYKVGDIITFDVDPNSKIPTTHRIVEKVKDGFLTKGDNNGSRDGLIVVLPSIRGKVYFNIPYFGLALAKLKEPKWFFILIILPASTLIYIEILNIVSEFKRLFKKRRVEHKKQSYYGIMSPHLLDLRTLYQSPYVLDLRRK